MRLIRTATCLASMGKLAIMARKIYNILHILQHVYVLINEDKTENSSQMIGLSLANLFLSEQKLILLVLDSVLDFIVLYFHK